MPEYIYKGRFTGIREKGTDYSVLFVGKNDFIDKGTIWGREADHFHEGLSIRAFKDLTDFNVFECDALDGRSRLRLIAFLDSDDGTVGTVFISETHTEEFEFSGCDCACSCCCTCCTNADDECFCGCTCTFVPDPT